MYWIMLTTRTTDDDLVIHGRPERIETLGVSFDQGIKIPNPIKDIEIIRTEEHRGNYTDNLISFGIPGLVINEKIQSILNELAANNIEYHDLMIHDEVMGCEISEYKIANIIGLEKCINMKLSQVRIDEDYGGIEAIERLVLDEKKLKETTLRIFRIMELEQIVLAHDSVKEAFEANNISGVEFMHPEKFVL